MKKGLLKSDQQREYRIRSDINPHYAMNFFRYVLDGDPTALTIASARTIHKLCEEFRYTTGKKEVEEFLTNKDIISILSEMVKPRGYNSVRESAESVRHPRRAALGN